MAKRKETRPGSLRTLLTFEIVWEPPVFRVSCEISGFLVTNIYCWQVLSLEADCFLIALVSHGGVGTFILLLFLICGQQCEIPILK